MSNGASNRSFLSDVDPQAFDRTFGKRVDRDPVMQDTLGGERLERPHDCEHCGRHMKYADQLCGCTAKRP